MTFILRPYQLENIQALRGALRAGHRRILDVIPTGGGKTLIVCLGVIAPASKKGKVCWFVAPKKDLVLQTSEKLDDIGIHHGIVQANHRRHRPEMLVQVCSKDTLIHRHKSMRAPDIIIADEAHNCTEENEWGQIIAANPNAVVLGMTATPCRLDGKGLGKIFQAMVTGPSVEQLQAEGFLIPMEVWHGPKLDLSKIPVSGADYNQTEASTFMQQKRIVGSIVGEWRKRAVGRPTIVFTVDVAHSMMVTKAFNDAGHAWAHIDANTPRHERAEIYESLKRRRICGVCSVGVLTEGSDLPCVGAVIFARPTKSLARYIQMAGRGIRPEFGTARHGEFCLALDHVGLVSEFGPIDQPREWSLEYGSGKAPVERKPLVCPRCQYEVPGRPAACPACGFGLREEKQRGEEMLGDDTELVKFTPEQILTAKADRLRERQEYYRQCEEQGFVAEWEPRAVFIRFSKKFGEWPSAQDRATSERRIMVVKRDGKMEQVWKHKILKGDVA